MIHQGRSESHAHLLARAKRKEVGNELVKALGSVLSPLMSTVKELSLFSHNCLFIICCLDPVSYSRERETTRSGICEWSNRGNVGRPAGKRAEKGGSDRTSSVVGGVCGLEQKLP